MNNLKKILWTYNNHKGTIVLFSGSNAEEFCICGPDDVSDETISKMSDLEEIEGWTVT